MKTIGLIGGTSWPSTIEYYRVLNQLVVEKCGGYHSARILLYSIDYHEIKSNYTSGWDKIPELLRQEIARALQGKPDCLILCNNTLHKAFDIIRPTLKLPIPFFHAVELTAEYAIKQRYKKVLLLATRFTMEDEFYKRTLEAKGLQAEIPNQQEREQIQNIQSVLATGKVLLEHKTYFKQLLERYKHLDAVILACTELPLAITQEMTTLPIIDPIEIQCQAAVNYALA